MLSRIITPETRGTYFGWSASVNTSGGIFCSFISGAIAYYANVRIIFVTGAVLLAVMIPLMRPTVLACRKEERRLAA